MYVYQTSSGYLIYPKNYQSITKVKIIEGHQKYNTSHCYSSMCCCTMQPSCDIPSILAMSSSQDTWKVANIFLYLYSLKYTADWARLDVNEFIIETYAIVCIITHRACQQGICKHKVSLASQNFHVHLSLFHTSDCSPKWHTMIYS